MSGPYREPGVCRLCQPDTPDTLSHSYLHCQNNVHAARYLLACVQQVSPNTTYEDLLLLQLDVDQQYELPLVTIIAAALKTIWDYRTQNKPVYPYIVKAEIQSRSYILKKTKHYQGAGNIMDNLLLNIPT